MTKSTTPVARNTYRDHVLSVAKVLERQVDDLDLEVIDSTFYWGCCRPDFDQAVKELRARVPPFLPVDSDTLAWEKKKWKVERMLTEGVDALWKDFGVSHQQALAYVTEQVPMAMRSHAIILRRALDPSNPEIADCIQLKVASDRRWKGADVERVVRDWWESIDSKVGGFFPDQWTEEQFKRYQALHLLDPHSYPYVDASEMTEDEFDTFKYSEYERRHELGRDPGPSDTTVYLSFSLVHEETYSESFWGVEYLPQEDRFVFPNGLVRPPYINVIIGVPLPPRGVIASNYDAIVHQHHRWHADPARRIIRQQNMTAIRTWAVSLLVADGTEPNRALTDVQLALENVKLTKITKFNRDRLALVNRVPEANDHVYARKH